MAQPVAPPVTTASAVSTENKVDVEPERTVRFNSMPLGEKYEGKYEFKDIDQADMEVALLEGKVEGLEAVIMKYHVFLANTVTRYKNAMDKCKNLHEDFKKLQREVEVQSDLMETARRDTEKIEEKIFGYKESMGKYELQLESAEEARRKVLNTKSHGETIDEGNRDTPPEQSVVESKSGRPMFSISKIDNEMVQKVVSRMAVMSETWGKGHDPLAKFPANCTLVIDGIPCHTNESMYLPALVSCFGQWEVPNVKVVAVNIPRDANHEAGVGGKYANRGHVFIRFAERNYMEEVRRMIDEYDPTVECDVKKKVKQRLWCRTADRDIGCKDYFKVDVPILERARYFSEVFECFSMNRRTNEVS